jgi:DNA ligase-1
MRLAAIAEVSRAVAGTPARLEKVRRLADALRRLAPAEVAVGVAWLSGDLPQGRLGVGPALVQGALAARPAAAEAALDVLEVDAALSALQQDAGAGSAERRRARLGALFARATGPERDFLARLLLGGLRQGALEGVLVDAVAAAHGAEPAAVRRAVMLAGALAPVAAALAEAGPAGLARFALRLFQPVQPMLAQPAEDLEEAFARMRPASLERKLDGARVQVHKEGDRVEVWSRRLNVVTAAVPEIVERVRAYPARSLVLDGEALALSAGGRPLPFQETMSRFGRRLEVERRRAERPLEVLFFDCLRLEDETLIDRPLSARWEALAQATGGRDLVPRRVTADAAEAGTFFAEALAAGHEGVMAKALESPYAAGRRGQEWLKLKAAHTLDLVVLAAEWGSGRREGWLSNLHLGARDPEAGGFVMLGKTFKGMTDETLRRQTEALLARELGREGHVVHVRPELVVEIAFNDVQRSPHYPGGVALRFARLKRYRPDKGPGEADTIASVRALLPREG